MEHLFHPPKKSPSPSKRKRRKEKNKNRIKERKRHERRRTRVSWKGTSLEESTYETSGKKPPPNRPFHFLSPYPYYTLQYELFDIPLYTIRLVLSPRNYGFDQTESVSQRGFEAARICTCTCTQGYAVAQSNLPPTYVCIRVYIDLYIHTRKHAHLQQVGTQFQTAWLVVRTLWKQLSSPPLGMIVV